MRQALLSALVVTALLGCTPGARECACFPCDVNGVVRLSVRDGPTGGPLSTFVVDATVNGTSIGEPPTCAVEARGGDSSCTFGDEGGLYHLVVGAPGYETREVLVRQPDAAGDLCCNQPICLTLEEVTVALDPLDPP